MREALQERAFCNIFITSFIFFSFASYLFLQYLQLATDLLVDFFKLSSYHCNIVNSYETDIKLLMSRSQSSNLV